MWNDPRESETNFAKSKQHCSWATALVGGLILLKTSCHPIIKQRLDRWWWRSTCQHRACPIATNSTTAEIDPRCPQVVTIVWWKPGSGDRKTCSCLRTDVTGKQSRVSTIRKCVRSCERTPICPYFCSAGRCHLPTFHKLQTISINSDHPPIAAPNNVKKRETNTLVKVIYGSHYVRMFMSEQQLLSSLLWSCLISTLHPCGKLQVQHTQTSHILTHRYPGPGCIFRKHAIFVPSVLKW